MYNKTLLALMLTSTFSAQAKDVRLIFEYNNGNKAELIQAVESAGGKIKVELDQDNAFSAVLSTESFANLKSHKAVKSIELDAPRKAIPLDVTTAGFADYSPYGLSMVQADQLTYLGNIKVCVVDTGYALGHPDLPSATVDGDSEGAGPWYVDGHGHGTHTAGTIAALDGNAGLTGVLGSGTPELHIARVFNDAGNWVYASDLAGAVNDCANAGSKVISMSLGGAFANKVEQRAFDRLERKGILAVAAAGNDQNATHSFPASYNAVVSVAAIDKDEAWAEFSQRTTQVELAAPGVDVISTYSKTLDEETGEPVPGFGYATMSGTSMATPHVSGVAALVWSHFPQCNNYEIRQALSASARDLGEEGRDYKYGNGLVQAKDAYDYLMANQCDGRGVK